ncbi:hypothetical protein [Pantoea sp.]|uniref:hypothetical protein n=1 Tax=Pantoea sp. TaxID=69393 RepID=UPI0028967B7A|nr:hypothetical protein [Pantoea sp.]
MNPLSNVLQLLAARSYITTGQHAGASWPIRYSGFADISRAGFARRFNDTTGTSPVSYLIQ